MRKFLSTIAVSGLLLGAAAITAPAANADPIECKGQSTSEKEPRGGKFECVNPGGGTPDGAVVSKNKNR